MKWFDMIPPELYGEPQKKPSGSAIGFTGFGQDGKLQPSNPTNMVQTTQGPRLLHEGEATMQGPDGNIQVIPQDKLRSIGRGMPGFQTGGTFTPLSLSAPSLRSPKIDVQTGGTFTPANSIGNTGLSTPPKTPIVSPIPPVKNPETDVQKGIGVLQGVVSGKSPVTESLYNQATSNLGGAQIAAIGAAKQEAAQAGYTKEGIGSVAQTAQRNMEGERSKLFGNIASATQNNMLNAAGQLISAGSNERSYTDTQNQKDWNEALLYNDPDTPSGQAALTEMWKKTHPGQSYVPDFNVMREERNYARTQREQSVIQGQQAITLGSIGISNAQIDNGVKAFNVEPNKMLALYAAIANGSVYDALSASNFLGKPVSEQQFNSMASDKKYTDSLRDVNLLSAKTQLDILKGSMETTKYQNLKQKIKDGATLDEIQKEDPKFSPSVYTAINRELVIEQGMNTIALDSAKLNLGNAAFSSLVNKVRESNGAYTLAQIKSMPEFSGMNITQEMLDGINYQNTQTQAKEAFENALLYNDPTTATGKTAIQKAWLAANPGKTIADAPDFNQLAEAAIAKRGDTAYTNTIRALNLSDAQFNSLTNRIKATNGKMTLAEAQAIVPGITQAQLDGLNAGAMKEQNKAIYEEMKLNFNPNDPDAKGKLQAAWLAANPGAKTAPDFTVLESEALSAQQERNDARVIAAGKLSEALIGDLIDTNGESINSSNILTSKTYQGAINNQNLRQSIATMNGWQVTDPRINGIIQSKIETAIKGDVPLLVQKFIDNGYVDERYKDTPGWEGALKRSIQDMLNSGAMDKDGKLTGTAAYPWNDPSTFNNYTDWNGNDIVYDAIGNKPAAYATTQVNITGNGTTYYKNVNGSKKPITFADMDNMWQTLSESEKASFFADDKGNPIAFDQKSFMNKYFINGASTGGVGTSGGVMLNTNDIDNYLFGSTENDVLNTIVGNINGDPKTGSTGFVSNAKYPGEVGEGSDPNAGVSLSTLNAYQYYDDKGVLHSDGSTAAGGDTQLNKIWLQFSQMFNGGKIMTAQQFKGKWNEGKGWYINEDGIVTNFLPDFKKTFGSNGPISTTTYYDKKGITPPTTIKSNADYSKLAKDAVNDPAKYQELLKNPYIKEWVPQTSYDSGGLFGVDKRYFTNPPAVGSVIKYGGGAYEVLTSVVMRSSGENTHTFTVRDLKDGTTRTIAIVGNHNGQLKVTGF